MWLYIFQFLGGVENVDPGLSGLTVFGNNPCKEIFEELVKAELFNRILTEPFEDNIGYVATLVLSHIK